MNFFGGDGWDNPRRPSPHHGRSEWRGDFDYLNPGMVSGLGRSRSHGHSRQPVVNVFNHMDQANANDNRSQSPFPPQVPYPMGSRRASPRGSPETRGRSSRLGDDIAEGLLDLALDGRHRSRSRGRSDVSPNGLAEWQLAQREAEIREEQIRRQMKLEQGQEELERERRDKAAKDREKRLLSEYERKKREEEDELKEAELQWKRRQQDAADRAKDEEQRIKDKIEKEKREAKEKAEAAEKEFLRRQKEKKEEEEARFKEFERIQKERADKKKAEEKEKELEFQNTMRKRLAALGYTEKTIEIMVDEEKAKAFKSDVETRGREYSVSRRSSPSRAPVYPKVHKDYLAVETLRYYDLPWVFDRHNPEYIIILRDMDKRETDILFEHTSRLRTKSKLLLEAPRKEKEYAWVRHRSKSRGGKERIGILKLG